jgi:hypothetical protein
LWVAMLVACAACNKTCCRNAVGSDVDMSSKREAQWFAWRALGRAHSCCVHFLLCSNASRCCLHVTGAASCWQSVGARRPFTSTAYASTFSSLHS